MKNNQGFKKQVIDSGRTNRERFPINYDVYTTAEIGQVQPIGVLPILAGSKTTRKERGVVRMLPMVVPTLGRIKQKTWHHFVGMSDMFRSWEAFLSKQVIGGASSSMLFRPDKLLNVALCDLSSLVLTGAHLSFYVFQPDEDTGDTDADGARSKWHLYKSDTTSDATFTAVKNFINSNVTTAFNQSFPDAFPDFTGAFFNIQSVYPGAFPIAWQTLIPISNASLDEFFDKPDVDDIGSSSYQPVSLDEANYVLRGSTDDFEYAIAVRLSALGKRLRKILYACGYKVNFVDTRPISVVPIMAYYKAYFDTFGLTYWHSWESTFCKILATRWDNDAATNLVVNPSIDASAIFIRFVLDCANSFVTEDKDYISAHTTEDAVNTSGDAQSDKHRGWLNNIVLDTPGTSTGVSGIGQNIAAPGDSVSATTKHVFINRVNHTEVDAELLKILYKWTNRETAAGRRIAELLRAAGFGKYVDEQKSNFIGYEEIELNVSDVNVTADSQNVVAGKNSVAGEYVGKGVGVRSADKAKAFSFENDEFGYWVTLSAVVVDSGYCQGVDNRLFAIEPEQQYTREFDGMGKELEPMSILVGTTDWQTMDDQSEFIKSFGMVPRESMWKVSHNILNGDYSLRGSGRDYFLPYSMDKFIAVGDRDCELVPSSGMTYRAVKKVDVSDLPVAGQAWRFLNRYPWLNNFERIFTYFGSDIKRFLSLLRDAEGLAKWEYCHGEEDHFNIQVLVDSDMYAPALPISESYGTTDDNDGHGDYVVNAS